jgi:hypothetical protein
MGKEFAAHEIDYIRVYQDKGYTSNFYFKNDKLINSETKNEYFPKDIIIVAEHRYEGMSDPSDMSILYIIETSKGEKGTFLMAYGPTANMDTSNFFNDIPRINISNKENINYTDS